MNDYEIHGVLDPKTLRLPNEEQLKKGVAIIECVQSIPCNPCVDCCPTGAISMDDINSPPKIDYALCTGCGRCVGVCPGLAIFTLRHKDGATHLSIPYEFSPLPLKGEIVNVLDRWGKPAGTATVIRSRLIGKTGIVTMEIPQEKEMDIRNIEVRL